MSYIKYGCFLLLLIISNASGTEHQAQATIIANTIERLLSDDLITPDNAAIAKQRYIGNIATKKAEEAKLDKQQRGSANTLKTKAIKEQRREQVSETEVSWADYLTLTNSIKVLAVVFVLIALQGIILKLIISICAIFIIIPPILLQLALLTAGLTAILAPEKISQSQAYYLVLIGSISNLMAIGWFLATHEALAAKLTKLLSFGLPTYVMAGAYLAAYFSWLAIEYQSSLLGIFAVIAMVAAMGFTARKIYGGFAIGVDESGSLPFVIWGNFVVLLAYSVISTLFPFDDLAYFATGIENVCALALSVCLLIGASPWTKGSELFLSNVLVLILSFSLALIGTTLFGINTIGTYINTVFALWLLEWVGYYTFNTSFILFAVVFSALLYSLALYLESNPLYFIASSI